MEKIIEGKRDLYDIKIKVQGNKILFPISAKVKYIKDDGRSFGYPVDDGWVTIIEYDYTVGALTEDTIFLLEQYQKKPKRPSVGIGAIESFSRPDSEWDEWKIGLDTNWAEKGDDLENYWSWPTNWQQAYNKHREEINKPVGKKNVVLINDALTLFRDDNDEYYFETRYSNHGATTKADKKSALAYIAYFNIYSEQLKARSQLSKNINENIKLLKSSLKEAV